MIIKNLHLSTKHANQIVLNSTFSADLMESTHAISFIVFDKNPCYYPDPINSFRLGLASEDKD